MRSSARTVLTPAQFKLITTRRVFIPDVDEVSAWSDDDTPLSDLSNDGGEPGCFRIPAPTVLSPEAPPSRPVEWKEHASDAVPEEDDAPEHPCDVLNQVADLAEMRAGTKADCERMRRETVEAASREAAAIIERAKGEAETLLARARADVEALEAEARERGLAQGREAAKEEAVAAAQTLTDLAAGIAREKARILAESESDLIDLALEIAKKIVVAELALNREAMIGIARSAIEAASPQEGCRLHLHPDDAAWLQERMGTVWQAGGVTPVADGSLEKGDVLVMTSHGRVDGRIDTQLSVLREALRKESGVGHDHTTA
ncbi:MAG: FliH/SctL family protein [Anaerolineae bacterium]|jgi:flagellar assembly protein FliH